MFRGGQPRPTAYDDNGNPLTRVDARATQTNTHDEVNRIKTRTYLGVATPGVTYDYDATGVPHSKGRLTSVSNSVATTSYDNYDELGRVKQTTQAMAEGSFLMQYAYDLAGNLTSETYPTGRVVGTSYDALNRPGGVTGTLGQGSATYADQFSYWPHGAVQGLRLGNNRFETFGYNDRLQATQIALGTTAGATDLLNLTYGYGTTNNNGNVRTQTITVPGGSSFTQAYGYDALNRLGTASETTAWSQTYAHDRFGNHAVTVSTGFTLSNLTPTSLSAFSTANNRLTASQYDSVGNQTGDAAGRAFGYDAENRQTTFGTSVSYGYDGQGRRVRKTEPSGATAYVYDALGRLIYEYATPATPVLTLNYLTADMLGSVRAVTDSTGAVVSRHDYLPFGEEIPSRLGGRSGVAGYAEGDDVRQRFAGKERDGESGLDYFGARYFSGRQGRFCSIDPIAISRGKIQDPQQLDAYVYARNNPLRFIDPDGERLNLANLSAEDRNALIQKLEREAGLTLSYNAKTGLLEATGKTVGGSSTFQKNLGSLIDTNTVFNVIGTSHYTDSEGEGIDVNFGLYERNRRDIVLDFSDFAKHPEIDLGLAFYHEAVGHGLKGLGDSALLPGNTAVDTTAQVGLELGLAFQAEHQTIKRGDRTFIRLIREPASPGTWKRLLQDYRLIGRGSRLVDITDIQNKPPSK